MRGHLYGVRIKTKGAKTSNNLSDRITSMFLMMERNQRMLYIAGGLTFHRFSAHQVIVRGREFGLKTTGLLHARPLGRGVRAPVALLTLAPVGRYGAVFPFASWADGTKVKLPTRILLKRLVFVVASLRSFF